MAPEFMQTTVQGVLLDRQLRLSSRASVPSPGGKTKGEDETLRIYGDVAVVAGRMIRDPERFMSGAYSRVWIRRTGVWLLAAVQFSTPNLVTAARPLVGPPAEPPPVPPEGKEVVSAIGQRFQSETVYDPVAYDRLTADDSLFIGPTAQFSVKTDRPMAFRATPGSGGPPPIDDLRVHVYGDAAIATFERGGTRLLMVWTKRVGRWQVVHIHQTIIRIDTLTG